METDTEETVPGESYLLVSNIPSDFHTSDLRRFFSDFIEREKLTCFHYRHRPERRNPDENAGEQAMEKSGKETVAISARTGLPASFSEAVTNRVHSAEGRTPPERPTCCCLVKLPQIHADSFITRFHRKHWLDSEDGELDTICLAARISEKDEREMSGIAELRPPNIMPRGNVGTSTQFFLDAIRECRLPAKLIGKLKLEFPKGRHKQYGSVPFQYFGREGSTFPALSVDRRRLKALNEAGPSMEDTKTDDKADDDDDTCEEWERHEALHNDVQANRVHGRQVNSTSYRAEDGDLEQQEGCKEKGLEGPIELVWEKGGSGLNFYTDYTFWKTQESQDFDEQNTDDWDVDMSVYYDKEAPHDKDAADRFSMRESEFQRAGQHEESAFKKPAKPPKIRSSWASKAQKRKQGDRIGKFQEHGTGIGEKLMRKSGWKDGMGLGARGTGIKESIDGEEDGQGPRDKKGFGFHGERVVFAPSKVVPAPAPAPLPKWSFKHPIPPPGQRISSVYTRQKDLDPVETLHRSNPPLYLKFRDHPVKFHSGGTVGGTYKSSRSLTPSTSDSATSSTSNPSSETQRIIGCTSDFSSGDTTRKISSDTKSTSNTFRMISQSTSLDSIQQAYGEDEENTGIDTEAS